VGDNDTLVQEFDEAGHDLDESGRVKNIRSPDAVNVLRTQVALRIHKRVPASGHGAVARNVHHGHLDDSVVPSRE
jgi:hypothetical protein